jgi:type IV secretion system protein VirD4
MEEFYNKDTLFGSAKWLKFEGMNDHVALEHLESGFFLGNSTIGDKNGRIIMKPKRHMLCVAPTRSGKGASLIIPNLMFNRSSTLIIDPKAELVFHTAERRRELGLKTYVLDPFQEFRKNYWKLTGDAEELTNFNPFSVLKNEQNKDYIRYIAESLIILRGVEPHWTESALEFTEGVIAYMIEKDDIEPSLPHFRFLVTQSYLLIAKMACETQQDDWPNDSIARRKLGRFADNNLESNKELCSIISTVITQTGFLDDQELREHLSTTTPGFSLDCLTAEGAGSTIYLVLPFDKMQTHGRWLRLIVSLAT